MSLQRNIATGYDFFNGLLAFNSARNCSNELGRFSSELPERDARLAPIALAESNRRCSVADSPIAFQEHSQRHVCQDDFSSFQCLDRILQNRDPRQTIGRIGVDTPDTADRQQKELQHLAQRSRVSRPS